MSAVGLAPTLRLQGDQLLAKGKVKQAFRLYRLADWLDPCDSYRTGTNPPR